MFLHENNLIHRDIKSENVLLYKTENRIVAKLADYGFVFFPNHTEQEMICGTIGFMAPEMVHFNIICACLNLIFCSYVTKNMTPKLISFLLVCYFMK